MKKLTLPRNCIPLMTSVLLLIAGSVFAAPSKQDEAIHVNADVQQFDLQKNIATFSGNVYVTRGTTKITANKAVVTQTPDGKQQIVEAFGSPVKFSTTLESGKLVTGHSSTLKYEAQAKRVTLTGNAYLEQEDSNIKSEVITYSLDKQIMNASGGKNKRVSTTLLPAQLQDTKKKGK